MRTRESSTAPRSPRRRIVAAAAALALAAGACRDDAAPQPASDSSLARDLALAAVLAQPDQEFNDAPLGEAPTPERLEAEAAPARVRARRPAAPGPQARRPSPRPAPVPRPRAADRSADAEERTADAPASAPLQSPRAAASPGMGAGFAAGTRLALSTGSRVCTVSGRPGDKLVATLREPVHGAGGAVIPAGSMLVLEVASVDPGQPAESGRITFRVRSLDVNATAYPARGGGSVSGDLQRAQVPRVNASDRRKVVTGAVAGAILGRVLGGGAHGAVIGAAAGGAAGAASAKNDEEIEGCLPAGSSVTIVLEEALDVS